MFDPAQGGKAKGVWRLSRRMDDKSATPDLLIAEIADRQHGVIAASQLNRLGVTKDSILVRSRTGRLHRVHRGVYAVGHRALSLEGRLLAGVLAVGGGPVDQAGAVLDYWGAAVSHRSAAYLWDLLKPAERPVDVITAGIGGRKKRRGLNVHRSRALGAGGVTLRRGIPVTTPARTILDLRRAGASGSSGAVSQRELRRAIRQANVLGLPIDEEDGRDRTRSDLESAFLALCRGRDLPTPEVNVHVGQDRVDFLWRENRLIVETDGYLYHRGELAFQEDRERDLRLKQLGYEVLRVSERQVAEELEQVADVLTLTLGQGAGP